MDRGQPDAAIAPARGGDRGVDHTQARVAQHLEELRSGDQAALADLFPILYEELRSLAHRQRQRWRGNDTLNTTALLHEAYLKLVDQKRVGVESRAHFFALAAKAMRHILSNYAVERQAKKRGGDLERISLGQIQLRAAPEVALTEDNADLLAALDGALQRLERIHVRQCKVVECRFYGGLSVEETAAALGISPRTVKRDWAFAQAWLHRELKEAV